MTKHGESRSKEYRIWSAMRRRCNEASEPCYEHYGGRGIAVCEEWDNSFEKFLSDMGKKPSDRHTLERIDNNRNYEPANCKWATWDEQGQNKRNTVFVEHDGKVLTLRQWSAETGIPIDTLRHRRRDGWSPERMLSQPVAVHAKITEDMVRAIRRESGTSASIGKKYGVSAAAVSMIRNRRNWKRVA